MKTQDGLVKCAKLIATASIGVALCGCASIDFGKDGLKYFDPVPYLLVSCTPEGTTMATVVVVPGEPKSLRFNNGFGSSSLTVELTNGMITSVGQEADSKIPETLTAALPILGASQVAHQCKHDPLLFKIVNGNVVAEDVFGSVKFGQE